MHKFWPFNPALMHLHSLLWFGVLIFVAPMTVCETFYDLIRDESD